MGKVYFVGAGPGDAGLITRRGWELLREADCILFDRLVSADVLNLAGKKSELIDVGKSSDAGGRSQGEINRLLVEKARRHRAVVRLKGGDPTLFGRIGEELGALLKAKIPFEIVPGVSSVWAAAAAAGIPLTDRRYSSSVVIATGQQADGSPKVKWETLAKGADTIVILMGRRNLPAIIRQLIQGGKSPATPIALIRWASTHEQEILVSTLGKVEQDLKAHPHFGPPVVAVIGEVVKRHRQFRYLPLKGKGVLITRPTADGAGLSKRLQALGARCVHLPMIIIRHKKIPKEEGEMLLARLPRYDWILFTSHHGVETLRAQATRFGKTLSRLVKGKVCAIGPRTACAVRETGLRVDLKPEQFSTRGIIQAFRRMPLSGRQVLIPRSNIALGDALSRELRRRGARVDEIILYETAHPKIDPRKVRKALSQVDVLSFTSASTVRGFQKALAGARLSVSSAVNGARVAAIGPETAKALRQVNIRKFHLPKNGSWTIEGLVGAITEAGGSHE